MIKGEENEEEKEEEKEEKASLEEEYIPIGCIETETVSTESENKVRLEKSAKAIKKSMFIEHCSNIVINLHTEARSVLVVEVT